MADHTASTEQKGRFEPKQAVQLDPPKDDPITVEHLAKCDGKSI
jgi:membrane-associated progesterone receptor component